MTVKTIRDIVHWTAEFHEQLSTCLQSCSIKSMDERAKMTLNYLATQEAHLAELVKRFEQTAEQNALDTWIYEYVQMHSIVTEKFCDQAYLNKSPDQIVDMVLTQHEQIIDIYQSLQTETEIPSVRELSKRLGDLQHQETGLMVQAMNRFADM